MAIPWWAYKELHLRHCWWKWFGSFLKTKHALAIWLNNCLQHLSQRNENSRLHKTLYQLFTDVLFVIPQKSQNLKEAKCPSIDTWLNKMNEWTVYLYHRILFSNKKEWYIQQLVWVSKALWEMKKFSHITCYNSIHITFLKWQNYRDGEQFSTYQALGMG